MEESGGSRVLERLLGRWSFVREISGQGLMTGTAMFDGMDDGRVAYRESGELLLECGQSLRAEQRYVYETMEDGFAVSFHTTGELFQRVVFAACAGDGWKGSASHSCKADVYDSEYVFRRDGMFVVRHEVRGPKKDYVIRTEYRRGQIGLE